MTIFRCEPRDWLPALLLPLAGCGANAQDIVNANAVYLPVSDNVSLDNFIGDLPRLTLDDKLKAMGPEGWHRIALYANWDFTDYAVWRWIVAQPDCDKGTALAIFWKGSPDYYLRYRHRGAVPADERDGYDLVTAIRDRWLMGGYKRAELAFDPATDLVAAGDYPEFLRLYGENIAKFVPPSMRVAVKGRRIENVGDPLLGVFGEEPLGNVI